MDEFPTMKEIAKQAVNMALKEVQINGIEFQEFLNRMNNAFNNNQCNLQNCRYNQIGICQDIEKRSECVDVSLKVLCLNREN